MAYGKSCPVCKAIVDVNEYSFAKDMCKDCADEYEHSVVLKAESDKLLNLKFEQMVLEV